MEYVVIAVGWLLVGAAAGVVHARHGHWRSSWAVSAILGPFAVIALASEHRHLPASSPTVLTTAGARRGPVDLLLGFDGSSTSTEVAALAIGLFGSRVRRVTLATVLDVETAAPPEDGTIYPRPWPEEQAARDHLDAAVSSIEANFGIKAGSVILAGAPADALERYAVEEGYEVIVVGCRGKGLSKRLLGSCASTLASRTRVPVLLIPATASSASTATASEASVRR